MDMTTASGFRCEPTKTGSPSGSCTRRSAAARLARNSLTDMTTGRMVESVQDSVHLRDRTGPRAVARRVYRAGTRPAALGAQHRGPAARRARPGRRETWTTSWRRCSPRRPVRSATAARPCSRPQAVAHLVCARAPHFGQRNRSTGCVPGEWVRRQTRSLLAVRDGLAGDADVLLAPVRPAVPPHDRCFGVSVRSRVGFARVGFARFRAEALIMPPGPPSVAPRALPGRPLACA
jgi:hypothetical protein